MRDVYIVECVRTPLGRGKKGGYFSNSRPVDILAITLSELLKRSKIDIVKNKNGGAIIEDVVCGCVTPINQQGGNIGRLALLKAGIPCTVPGIQINRMCGSAQQAIHFAAQEIASGDMDITIGCGIELMSIEKMGSDIPVPSFMKLLKDFPYPLISQGLSAEKIAKKYNITREECDKLAFDSHHKAGLARNKGFFDQQIIPMTINNDTKDNKNKQIEVYKDEGIRYPPDMNSISKLKTVFSKNGVVTAGNSSQITDGSSAVLLASSNAIKKYGLNVRARIIARVVVGSDPILMLDGVIPATEQVLKKAKLTLNDIDLFEINEAFAVVVCAWQKTLNIPWNKVNICGGACAHGHPLGATGAVLMTKLVHDLEREQKRYGLQTMCIGWGMATATIIERCNSVQEHAKL